MKEKKIDLVILAGGRGTRINRFLNNKPKPLIKIKKIPFLQILLNKFSVYPNPSSNFIKLKSLENNDEYMISIFDIFGKEIIHNLKNPKQIDISSFVKGQYIMKIETKDGIINERLLKI